MSLVSDFEGLVNAHFGAEWRVNGTSSTEALKWNELPLSSIWSPIIAATIYLVGGRVAKKIMTNRDALNAPWLQHALIIHNLLLTLVSAMMFIGVSVSVVTTAYTFTTWSVYADPDWILPSSSVPLWCYIFYASKYYELVDTLFLIVKKKPVRLVQTFHHTTVLFLFWTMMQSRMYNHWMLVMVNSFVHIFVYGYFLAACLKIPVPWKRYITLLQITQFVAALLYALPFPYFKTMGQTRGDWEVWLFGQFIGLAFIGLFLQVYLEIKRKAVVDKQTAGKKDK